MKEQKTAFLLRLPAELKARIEELAIREHRSTNQQIEFLLERALADHAKDEDRSTNKGQRSKGPSHGKY